MSKISFEDIGSLIVTFGAQGGVQAGQVVKVTGNGTVGPCQQGDAFCGVAGSVKNGAAAVQVAGFMEVAATLPLKLGNVKLAANGAGGVKETEDGVSAIVVEVDEVGSTAVICL